MQTNLMEERIHSGKFAQILQSLRLYRHHDRIQSRTFALESKYESDALPSEYRYFYPPKWWWRNANFPEGACPIVLNYTSAYGRFVKLNCSGDGAFFCTWTWISWTWWLILKTENIFIRSDLRAITR